MRYDSPIPARAIRERPASECESGRDGGSGEEALAFRIPTPNPNPGPMSVLRFDNVSKQYPGGHVALSAVSFDVGAGEMSSEERSVGKECVSACRSRWLPYNTKKK